MHHSGETGIPAFLTKLWTLLEDPSTDELICWDPNGRSFHIYEQARFAKEVLPHYFKHNNIASFVRQLNMYGFRKIVNIEHGGLKVERDDMEFAHQHFIQGRENLLENIKRKVTNVRSPGDDVKVKPDDVHKVLSDVRGIRGKQEVMNDKLESLKHENETLWREVATLRQKHMKQQQIVNKLIQFLVTMVGNRPVRSMKRKMPLMLNDASQLGQAPSKAPKLERTLSIEAGQQPTAYSVQSPPESTAGSTGPHTLTIRDVTDSSESPSASFPQVPPYDSIAGQPFSLSAAQAGDLYIASQDDELSAVNPTEVLSESLSQSLASHNPTEQPQVVPGPVDASQLITIPISGHQMVAIPTAAAPTIAATATGSSMPVQVIILPTGGAPVSDTAGVVASTVLTGATPGPTAAETSGFVGTAADGDMVQLPITNSRNSGTIPSTNVAAMSGNGLMTRSKTDTNSSKPCTSVKEENCKELQCCKRQDVEEHVEELNMELDGLKDIMTGNYNLDTSLLSGLFTPEAPLPPTPEGLLSLDDFSSNSIIGNELMAYNPQTEDISRLFDLDVSDDPEDNTGLNFEETSGMETPIFNPSTPMPSLNLSSALAGRRKGQPNPTSTDEVD